MMELLVIIVLYCIRNFGISWWMVNIFFVSNKGCIATRDMLFFSMPLRLSNVWICWCWCCWCCPASLFANRWCWLCPYHYYFSFYLYCAIIRYCCIYYSWCIGYALLLSLSLSLLSLFEMYLTKFNRDQGKSHRSAYCVEVRVSVK